MLYYATYEDFSNYIIEFTTREARDEWVNYEDAVSKMYEISEETYCISKRKAVTNIRKVLALLNDPRVSRYTDEDDPDMIIYFIPVEYHVEELPPLKIS